MKKLLIIGFLVLGHMTFAQGKKDKEAIKEVITKMMALNEKGDLIGALDYTYPKLFELVPREMIEGQITSMIEDAGIVMSFKNFEIKEMSEIKSFEEYKYATVNYVFDLNMTYNSEEMTKEALDATLVALIGQFGEGNVKIDYDTKTFEIFNNSTILAIKDKVNDWSVLELKPELVAVLGQIIPEEILEDIQ